MKDIRQDKRYAKYLSAIGWDVDEYNSIYVYSKRLPLIGLSISKIQRPEKILETKHIKKILKKRRSIHVVIEPSDISQRKYYLNKNFKHTNSVSLPSKTILLDITKSNDELLNQMHSKTRYNINKHATIKKDTKLTDDIEKFVYHWQQAARSRGMYISQKRELTELYKAFSNSARLVVFGKKQFEAGLMLIISNSVSYYMHAFSTPYGKKCYAPTILTWESIKLSKKLKCTTYDFEGIYDERAPLKSWKGFSRFKRSFGGSKKVMPLPVRKFVIMS